MKENTCQNDVVQVYCTSNSAREIEYYSKMFQTIEENGKGLMNLNVNRGGKNAFGFVFEYQSASAENVKALVKGDHSIYQILNNNGACDMVKVDTVTKQIDMYQLKATGMQKSSINSTIKPENYPGQTIMTPLENSAASNRVIEKGGVSQKSWATRKGAEVRADIGKLEGKITRLKTAPIIGSLDLVRNQIMATTAAGVNSAVHAGAFAAGVSIGNNLVSMCVEGKDYEEVILDVAKDTGKALKAGFLTGAAGYTISGIALHSATVMSIVQTASTAIMSFGPISMVLSLGAVPLFLGGLAIGAGISLCNGIINDKRYYKALFDSKYDVLHEELLAFRKIYNDIDLKLLSYCGLMDKNITDGLDKIASSIYNNNFDLFVDGLNITLNEFNRSVLFKNLDQFDEYFYDDDAVLEF